MSETLQPASFLDTLAIVAEQANDDPAFHRGLISGVRIPYGWERDNTEVATHLLVRRDINALVDRTAYEVYGDLAALACTAELSVSTLHDRWPEDALLHADDRGEKLMGVEGGILKSEHTVAITFSAIDFEWNEHKDYCLTNPDGDDYWDGVDLPIEFYDSTSIDSEERAITTMSDEEIEIFNQILGFESDAGAAVISESVLKRVRQVRAIMRIVQEGVPIVLEPFFENGSFIPLGLDEKPSFTTDNQA